MYIYVYIYIYNQARKTPRAGTWYGCPNLLISTPPCRCWMLMAFPVNIDRCIDNIEYRFSKSSPNVDIYR